jgi:lysophospholipase L1-like esterase
LSSSALPLTAAKIALAPALLWQGRQVRRQALRLPEAAGPRQGAVGDGPGELRLLIVGDSSGAGVGAAHQDQALAGRLAHALAQRLGLRVHWQLQATTGHDSADALAALQQAELAPAELMVTALGVNDVVGQVSPRRWLATLGAIDKLARERAGVRYTLHSAVPPMHLFPLLPQPLRWMLGAQAAQFNRALELALRDREDRGMHAMPDLLGADHAAALMAEDGFHPGPAGYRLWADTLAERLARELLRSH